MEFKRVFGKNLADIKVIDYKQLITVINADLELTLSCLTVVHFETVQIYPQRIAGNAKLAAHEVRFLWGSSGNSEQVATLPLKVRKLEGMMHQQGTAGRIYFNLLNESTESSFIMQKQGEPLNATLYPGCGLMDAGAFFTGKKAEDIVTELDSKLHIRYTNSLGQERIRTNYGRDLSPQEAKIASTELATLYAHKDRRGVNYILPSQTKIGQNHLMTVSSDMTFTTFSQGVMRFRNWGKGQKVTFILDEGMANKMQSAHLTQLEPPVQLMAILLENEARELAKLHTMSNLQEIEAINVSAIQSILRLAQTKEEWKIILDFAKKHKLIKQDTQTEVCFNPEPKVPTNTKLYLENKIVSAQALLHTFLNLPGLSAVMREKVQLWLELFRSKLILDSHLLEPYIMGCSQNEGTEEIEVEQQQEEEQSAENEVEVDAAVAVELEIEEEEEDNIEQEVVKPRPNDSKVVMWGIDMNKPKEFIFLKSFPV